MPKPPDISYDTKGPMIQSVFVCPATRDFKLVSDFETITLSTDAERDDGYMRDEPRVFQEAPYRSIIDIGYGCNGLSGANGNPAEAKYLPMQSIANNAAGATKDTFNPLNKVIKFKQSSRSVLLFDGSNINAFNALTRISGARHGRFIKGRWWETGTTNVLFLDGHAEGIARADLPGAASTDATGTATAKRQIIGTRTEMKNNLYYWNYQQMQ